MTNESTPKKTRPLLVWVTIAVALGLVALDSIGRSNSIHITSTHNLGTPPPAVDPDSPTGYELGMRNLVLPTAGTDGYQWIMHTQKLLHDGTWRIRFTDQDNAPTGREIHWSHGFIWWLIGVGKIHSLMTGLPLPASVEAVAPWANTLFLAALILLLPWVVCRYFGFIPACITALSLPATYTFYEFFAVGYPDHHGLTAAGALLAVLFLGMGGAGWVSTGGKREKKGSRFLGQDIYTLARPQANFCFSASAVAGAVSLWVSAATAVPTLLGIAAGMVLSLFLKGEPVKGRIYEPGLWRRWGITGCLASLGFYLLEYFPGHLGMRLEVNHPLYAIAWLGGGEILARFAEWRMRGVSPWSGRLFTLLLALGSVLIVPLLVVSFRDQVFLVADPFLWRLHKDYINEFKPLSARVRSESLGSLLIFLTVLPLLALGVTRLLFLKTLDRSWKTMLVVAAVPALFVSLLSLEQIRWTGIANSLWLATLPIWVACLLTQSVRQQVRPLERLAYLGFFLLLLTLHPWVMLGSFASSLTPNPLPPPDEAFGMVTRELAHKIRRRAGERPITILSGPTSSTWMMYFGGFKGVGTLYWENIEGVKAAAAMYEADSDEKALELLKKNQITHVAIFSVDNFVYQYPRLIRNLPLGSKSIDAFIPRIFEQFNIPNWINPVFCPLPDSFRDQWIALFEVKPGQSQADWEFAFGRFYMDKQEWPAAANHLKKSLAATPGQQHIRRELVRALFLAGKNAEAQSEFEAAISDLPARDVTEWASVIALECQSGGLDEEATFLLRRALEVSPEAVGVRNSLAWVLATSKLPTVRKPAEALSLALSNEEMASKFGYFNTLAAAYAANQEFAKAVFAAENAMTQASIEGLSEKVMQAAARQLEIYKSGGVSPVSN